MWYTFLVEYKGPPLVRQSVVGTRIEGSNSPWLHTKNLVERQDFLFLRMKKKSFTFQNFMYKRERRNDSLTLSFVLRLASPVPPKVAQCDYPTLTQPYRPQNDRAAKADGYRLCRRDLRINIVLAGINIVCTRIVLHTTETIRRVGWSILINK